MNSLNVTGLNLTGNASPYTYASMEPIYTQHKPVRGNIVELPKPVLYLLMAAVVVVGVAYAIVGHLIKDLAIDIAECMLGPASDDDKENNLDFTAKPSHAPPIMTLPPYNAFHVWDPDEVVVPLPPEESPQLSPLLAAIPYIPAFFPVLNNSPATLNSGPGTPNALPTAV